MRTQALFALVSSAVALAAPSPQQSGVQSSNTDNQAQDLLSAYESAASALEPAQSAPAGAVEEEREFNPTPVASAAAADATNGGIHKRAACDPEPSSPYAVTVNPDRPESWAAYPDFHTAANNAPAPAGYILVPGYKDRNASAQANVYQGVTSSLSSYDPSICSTQCNTIVGCMSFVIYFERDPTLDANDAKCPDPPSLTRIKCAFYGIPLTANQATNDGQWRSQFHVLIAGANAYTIQPAKPPGYNLGDALGDRAIMSPISDNTYMGVQTFPNSAYDPSLCGAACTKTTQYWRQHTPVGQPVRECNFFDAYMLYKNNKDPIFTCAYYTRYYDASFAKNIGQYDSKGNHFTIANSVTYVVAPVS